MDSRQLGVAVFEELAWCVLRTIYADPWTREHFEVGTQTWVLTRQEGLVKDVFSPEFRKLTSTVVVQGSVKVRLACMACMAQVYSRN